LGNTAESAIDVVAGPMKALFDIGFCGLLVNVAVFVVVSRLTKPLAPEHVKSFENDLRHVTEIH